MSLHTRSGFVLFALLLIGMIQAQAKNKEECPSKDKPEHGSKVILWEQRGPQRLDQNLLTTDGLGYGRDVGVYLCYAQDGERVSVRAWVRPQDGQWREIQILDLTQLEEEN